MAGGGGVGVGATGGAQRPRRAAKRARVAGPTTFASLAQPIRGYKSRGLFGRLPKKVSAYGGTVASRNSTLGGNGHPRVTRHGGGAANYYEAQAGAGFKNGKSRARPVRPKNRRGHLHGAPAAARNIG